MRERLEAPKRVVAEGLKHFRWHHHKSQPWPCRKLACGSPGYPPRHYLTVRSEVIVDNLTNLLCFFRPTIIGKIDDLRGHDSLPFRDLSKRRRSSLCLRPFLRTFVPALVLIHTGVAADSRI